jgi:C4-type Zn-finger protein
LIKDIEKLEAMIESIDNVGTSKSESLTLEFLDPHGNSMIIDSNATERELSEDELEALPVGPEPAVFSKNEL